VYVRVTLTGEENDDNSFLSAILGGSVAEWLACWTQAQKGLGSNRSNSPRQTVHSHCASVHQAAKSFGRVTAGLAGRNGSLPCFFSDILLILYSCQSV